MGTTTFTGPVRSGPILNTSGDIIGVDVANVGFAVLAQSFPIVEDGATTETTIVLPVGATILFIQFNANVAFGANLDVLATDSSGTTASIVAAATPTLGINAFTPGTLSETTAWQAATTDIRIDVTSAAAGVGEGVLTVIYVQN